MLMIGRVQLALALMATMLPFTAQAKSLEPVPGEEETLKACEKSVCEIILGKQRSGPPPNCNITKTWSQSTIKEGESQSVSWGFGDARCTAKLEIDRAQIVKALTEDKHTLQSPTQTVKCQIVQDGELKPITAKAAPKLKFKKGKADKVWINLEKIDGPDNVTGTISTIAAMEDKLGIFHSSLIKSINKFIHKRCEKKYGPNAEKDEEAKKKKKKEKAAEANDAAAKPAADKAAKKD